MTKTIIEILIDLSGSMGFMKGSAEYENKCLINGNTRLSVAKKILIEHIIPTIEYANIVFIRTFRTEDFPNQNMKKGDLNVNLIYNGIFDKVKINSIIYSLQDPPSGGTPITDALNISLDNLKNYDNFDRKIILITDGEENGNGDYTQSAKKALKLTGIPCETFIVGIAQDEQAEKKAVETATGGYVNIKNQTVTSNDIEKVLLPLKKAVLQNSLQNFDKSGSNYTQPISKYEDKTKEAQIVEKLKTLDTYEVRKITDRIAGIEKIQKDQTQNITQIFDELSFIKDILRTEILQKFNIDSTTLTLDTEYAESIRKKSEEFVYKQLCGKFGSENVNWMNKDQESYSLHDFVVTDNTGAIIKLIECKGTPKDKPTFYLTSNEWEHFTENTDIYQIYRVFNVENEMYSVCIENLLESLLNRKVVPYLTKPEILKEERVFLTLHKI